MNGSTRQLEKKFKNIQKQMKMKIQQSKPFGMQQRQSKRKIQCNPGLSQETNKQTNHNYKT